MGRIAGVIESNRTDTDRELQARAGVERASTLSLVVVVLAGLGASYLSFDSRTTASVVVPAAVFFALWIVPQNHHGADLCRQAYGWAAACFAVLAIAGIPVLMVLGPVSVVAATTVVIAAWMRSMSLVVLSIVTAAVAYTGLGGAMAYAAEDPSVDVGLCMALLVGLIVAYVRFSHREGPEAG